MNEFVLFSIVLNVDYLLSATWFDLDGDRFNDEHKSQRRYLKCILQTIRKLLRPVGISPNMIKNKLRFPVVEGKISSLNIVFDPEKTQDGLSEEFAEEMHHTIKTFFADVRDKLDQSAILSERGIMHNFSSDPGDIDREGIVFSDSELTANIAPSILGFSGGEMDICIVVGDEQFMLKTSSSQYKS